MNKQLKINQIGNYFIEIAQLHSENLGLDVETLMKKHMSWVLSRMSVQINDTPRYMDRLKIVTTVEAMDTYKSVRSFTVFNQDDEVVIRAQSLLSIINLRKRNPVNLSTIIKSDWNDLPPTDKFIRNSLPKILGKKGDIIEELKVRYSDIDVLGHMYSMGYIAHAQDVIGENLIGKRIVNLTVNYISEIKLDTVAEITLKEEEKDTYKVGFYHKGSEKPLFIAKFHLQMFNDGRNI